jgi:hypothetical protein
MGGFLAIIGALAALFTIIEMFHAMAASSGVGGGLAGFMVEGHAIELAILTAVCFAGSAVLRALQGIAERLDELAGKPAPPPAPAFGAKPQAETPSPWQP